MILSALIVTFVPSFIQFAHFGTTESLLMLLYILLLYISLQYLKGKTDLMKFSRLAGALAGIAIGVKVSSVFFVMIPLFALFSLLKRHDWRKNLRLILISVGIISGMILVFMFLSSPHNFLSFEDFLGSMRYESEVGLGGYRAFYTRQFEYSLPVLFQFIKVFPYTLGAPFALLFVFAFFLLPYTKLFNYLRLLFLFFFIPNAVLYAKWSRFLAPLYPLMILFVILFVMKLAVELRDTSPFKKTRSLYYAFFCFVIGTALLPGIAYLSIYTQSDVRFVASSWIYDHIPAESPILAETANVVDIPMPSPEQKEAPPHYSPVSFNFYDLHLVEELRRDLASHKAKSPYVFVPSRRVFANHTCYIPTDEGAYRYDAPIVQLLQGYDRERCNKLARAYPELQTYYAHLFNTDEYTLLRTFHSFPRITLFGATLIEFPDEWAEETWTVFDHPVIRIYQKN
jgi:hypothetical protein